MDPITIGIGATILGSLLGAADSYQQGQEAAEAARANARFAEADAQLALLAAADAIDRGQRQAGQLRMQGTKVIGEQRAAFGASGVDVGTGAPVALAAETRMISEMDARTAANNAAREAWGLSAQARNLRSQASEYRRQAGRAGQAGYFGAAGSLLTGGARVGSMLG